MKSIRRPLLIAAALVVASLFIYSFWWPTTEVVFLGNFLQASSLAYCGMRFNSLTLNAIGHRKIWPGWAGISAGVWCWFLAQFLETYREIVLSAGAYGTIADCFWGLGAFFYFVGTSLLLKFYWGSGAAFRISTASSLPLLLIVAAYVPLFLWGILPHLTDPSRSSLLKLLDFSYPTIDLITAFCYCLLFLMARARGHQNFAGGALIVCLAFLLWTFCDLAWAHFRDVDSLVYRLQDIAFFIGYCANGIAATPFENSENLTR